MASPLLRRIALPTACVGVVATLVGIAINIATSMPTDPVLWIAVALLTACSVAASLWLHARGQEADPPPGDGSPPGPPGQQNSIHIEGSNNGAISIMNVNRVPSGLLFGVAALAAAAISVLVVSLDVRHSPGPDPLPPGPTLSLTPGPTSVPTELPRPSPTRHPPPRSVVPGPSDGPAPSTVSEGPASPVGRWLSAEETWVTLWLNADGTFRREDPLSGDTLGRYTVEGATTFTSTVPAPGRADGP